MKTDITTILFAPWIMGVIVTAIRLRVFSTISDSEMTAEEIAAACSAVPERLEPILEAGVCLGFLQCRQGKYKNTHFSAVYLVEGQRTYVGDFIKLINDESRQSNYAGEIF